jgi:hypothetical protein
MHETNAPNFRLFYIKPLSKPYQKALFQIKKPKNHTINVSH